jgi:hypothetical protein
MRSFWAPAVALLAIAVAQPAHAGPQEGKKAPSLGQFEVVQGEQFTDLKELKGRAVRLVFFATW